MSKYKGGSHQDATPSTFSNAKFLREHMTVHEKILWNRIRNKQILRQKLRRQHPIGRYVLDFFYLDRKLSIEIDGSSHRSQDQIVYDNERTEYLKQHGIHELRFTNKNIEDNIEGTIEIIQSSIRLFQDVRNK